VRRARKFGQRKGNAHSFVPAAAVQALARADVVLVATPIY
jgi:NAD(P)H-dependent FMN reductase